MIPVWVPILYIVVLVGSLYSFSQFYRKRAAGTPIFSSLTFNTSPPAILLARLQRDPWWPIHHERDVYISLLQQTDPPSPEYILKAALLRRAVTDITRIHSMREDKQAATVLVQKGSVGDDLLTRLLAAEKELETEILEVVGEANSFKEGWGAYIFQTASEMLANEKTRELFLSLPKLKSEMAGKYGKKKRAKTIDHPASSTSPSAQTIIVSSNPSVTALSANNLPPPTTLSAGSDADDSPTPSPSRTTASRGKKGRRRK